VSGAWINSQGKQKSSRRLLLEKKKKKATNNNKGSWVESRKCIGKACCCRKINVILTDNEEVKRRQNFLTQVL